jgi:hypothetical protein
MAAEEDKMAEQASAQAPRVRANAKEQKGGFTVDVTVETYNGEDTAAMLAQKITEVKAAMTAAGHKLVGDAA